MVNVTVNGPLIQTTRTPSTPLDAAIRDAGLTGAEVAEAARISRTWLSLLRQGHRQPSPQLAAHLALLLGRPVEELF